MPIATKIESFMERSSWIREMFEAGAKMKAELGADNVFDFSLGNPDLEPPAEFKSTLRELIEDDTPGVHGYMPNSGWPSVRACVADYCGREFGLGFTANDVIMTCGAGGALNIALKTILDPGDEVIVPQPYFVEYDFYVDNFNGVIKRADTNPDFTLNIENIAKQFTPKTRAVLINSPNNPTGVIYPEENIKELSELLEKMSAQNGRPVILISDEPYRKIVYENAVVPSVFTYYPYVFCLTSYSKDLSLPGERIGFLVVHPDMPGKEKVIGGLILSNRILGFVSAPSLMQRAVGRLQGKCVDIGIYGRRRDMFVKGLKDAGYDLEVPQGAFYLFPKAPIEDDVAFVRELQKENILGVPGSGFKGPGYFRLTYCVPEDVIERSLPGFKRARERMI